MTTRAPSLWSTAALCVCILCTAAIGDVRILIDQQLHQRPVDLVGVEQGRALVRDGGTLTTLEPGQWLALVSPQDDGASQPSEAPVITLIDGQRIVGSPAGALIGDDGAAGVWWEHDVLGDLHIPIADIAAITLRDSRTPAPQGLLQDVVILANGDQIEGFVLRIGSAVAIDVSGATREIPIRAVAAIVLANPRRDLAGMVVWLADGSVLAVDALIDAGEQRIGLVPSLRGAPEGTIAQPQAVSVPVSGVLAMCADAASFEPLAALELEGMMLPDGRRWSAPVQIGASKRALLGAAPIELPGPMSLVWRLPEGASRLAFTCELPQDMRAWGDCELVIDAGRGDGAGGTSWIEIARHHLTRDNPLIRVNAPITAPLLRITLEPGRYGPIQDSVVIRRALIRIDPPGAGDPSG